MNPQRLLVSARGAALAALCGGLFFTASADAEDAFGIVIAPRLAVETQAVALQQDADDEAAAEEGLPTIVPRSSAAAPADAEEAPEAAAVEEASGYAATFRSIPFSRAEFDANPSYRHEATMEILTGNPRPQKIVVNQPDPVPPVDYYPLNLPVMRHYFDMSRGPYSRYQRLFGYEGGYRRQFYHD
jgi:hypothetical protein